MQDAVQNAVQDVNQATHDAIDTVWRLEAAKVIGAVARLTHDLGIAEELAGDALVAALEHWRHDGVPANPGAWLTTTAKRRALDWLRHRSMAAAEHEALARDDEARQRSRRCPGSMISNGAARRLIDFSAIEWHRKQSARSDWQRRKR